MAGLDSFLLACGMTEESPGPKETYADGTIRDMAAGNTVSATIASAYGCFWLSFAVILIPGFQVAEAYTNPAHYTQANGFFMLVRPHPTMASCASTSDS